LGRAVGIVAEEMESRVLLTGVVVNSTLDNVNDSNVAGPVVTFREAINYADSATTSTTITFDPTVFPAGQLTTITLGGSVLGLVNAKQSVIIQGLGADRIAVNGNNASGVFAVGNSMPAQINELTITGGRTNGTSGGGLQDELQNSLTLNNDVFTGNSNQAIFADDGMLTLDGTTVSGNQTFDVGGGLFLFNENAIITNSAICNNAATDGSGIYFQNDNAFALSIVNTTISGNTASNGSALSLVGSSGSSSVALTDDTISNNANAAATNTGGVGISIFRGVINATLNGTIASGNTANGAESDLFGTFAASRSYNLIGTGGNLVNGTNHNQVGVNSPLLAPLGNYGGPTQTMALLPGSPAIDAGSTFNDAGNNPITTDQRGDPRHSTPDVGAYEAARGSLVVTTTADEDNGTSDPLYGTGTSLREAVNYAETLTGPQTITFAPALAGDTITLSATGHSDGQTGASALGITGSNTNITIDCGSQITLSGGVANTRGFYVGTGATLSLQNITISHFVDFGFGGSIFSVGTINVTACTFFANSAGEEGGAIEVHNGSATIANSAFNENTAPLAAPLIT
jgi:CSLREA domain-containing protein